MKENEPNKTPVPEEVSSQDCQNCPLTDCPLLTGVC